MSHAAVTTLLQFNWPPDGFGPGMLSDAPSPRSPAVRETGDDGAGGRIFITFTTKSHLVGQPVWFPPGSRRSPGLGRSWGLPCRTGRGNRWQLWGLCTGWVLGRDRSCLRVWSRDGSCLSVWCRRWRGHCWPASDWARSGSCLSA